MAQRVGLSILLALRACYADADRGVGGGVAVMGRYTLVFTQHGQAVVVVHSSPNRLEAQRMSLILALGMPDAWRDGAESLAVHDCVYRRNALPSSGYDPKAAKFEDELRKIFCKGQRQAGAGVYESLPLQNARPLMLGLARGLALLWKEQELVVRFLFRAVRCLSRVL